MKRDTPCCKREEKYSSKKSVPGWFQWFYMVFASSSEKVEVVSDKEVFTGTVQTSEEDISASPDHNCGMPEEDAIEGNPWSPDCRTETTGRQYFG